MDCWSEWAAAFRPFERLPALISACASDKLNVPLTGLDTHRGFRAASWRRATGMSRCKSSGFANLLPTKQTLYAGKLQHLPRAGYLFRTLQQSLFPATEW